MPLPLHSRKLNLFTLGKPGQSNDDSDHLLSQVRDFLASCYWIVFEFQEVYNRTTASEKRGGSAHWVFSVCIGPYHTVLLVGFWHLLLIFTVPEFHIPALWCFSSQTARPTLSLTYFLFEGPGSCFPENTLILRVSSLANGLVSRRHLSALLPLSFMKSEASLGYLWEERRVSSLFRDASKFNWLFCCFHILGSVLLWGLVDRGPLSQETHVRDS